MEDIRTILMDKGLKPSLQRIRILENLKTREDHPTVDMIYSALMDDIPTLSKTTVYNTVKLFVQAGLVVPLIIEGNETRYDAETHIHGHFRCDNCGKIFDMWGDFSKLVSPKMQGFEVREHHIYFKGLCQQCREKPTNQK